MRGVVSSSTRRISGWPGQPCFHESRTKRLEVAAYDERPHKVEEQHLTAQSMVHGPVEGKSFPPFIAHGNFTPNVLGDLGEDDVAAPVLPVIEYVRLPRIHRVASGGEPPLGSFLQFGLELSVMWIGPIRGVFVHSMSCVPSLGEPVRREDFVLMLTPRARPVFASCQNDSQASRRVGGRKERWRPGV